MSDVYVWLPGVKAEIGDKWSVKCHAPSAQYPEGYVDNAIPLSTNKGSYVPAETQGYLGRQYLTDNKKRDADPVNDPAYYAVVTIGGLALTYKNRGYRGRHDTIYIIEVIDFKGYIQNYENALLQICLATATDQWVDHWGEYFGINRLLFTDGPEDDVTYKNRIIMEITRAKCTVGRLLEESIKYFKTDNVSIIEYRQWCRYDSIDPIIRCSFPTYSGTATSGSTISLVDTPTDFLFEGIKVGDKIYHIPSNGYSFVTYITTTTTSNDTLFFDALTNNASFSAGEAYILNEYDNDAQPPRYWDIDDVTGIPASRCRNIHCPRLLGLDIQDPITKLFPYQFYINPPVFRFPSAKFIHDGTLLAAGTAYTGSYIAHGDTGDPGWPGTYAPANRRYPGAGDDRNNIYIYRREGFAVPSWESGLQVIIDRLKAAGTVAIINPLE